MRAEESYSSLVAIKISDMKKISNSAQVFTE